MYTNRSRRSRNEELKLNMYEFDIKEDRYVLVNTIPINDILDFNYVARDYQDVSELRLNLKAKKYQKLVPNNKYDQKRPLLVVSVMIDKNTKENVAKWVSFIYKREYKDAQGVKEVILYGYDFKFFEARKLIRSNKDQPNVSPDNMPDDFGKYNSYASIIDHLTYFYKPFFDGSECSYGRLSTVSYEFIKFKGLDRLEINLTHPLYLRKYTLMLDSESIFTAKDKLYSLNETLMPFVSITDFDFNLGKVFLKFYEPREKSNDIVKKLSDIKERLLTLESDFNSCFGYGDPDNYMTKADLDLSDFTSLEFAEDFSFVAHKNTSYLDTLVKTNVYVKIKDRIKELLKIDAVNLFVEFNIGDLINLNEKTYRLIQIQESFSSDSGIVYDIEIEEKQNNINI